MALWKLKYRRAPSMAVEVQIEASNLEMAEKVGRKYCEVQSRELISPMRFIGVYPVSVANESILKEPGSEPEPERVIQSVPHQEQIERIQQRNASERGGIFQQFKDKITGENAEQSRA